MSEKTETRRQHAQLLINSLDNIVAHLETEEDRIAFRYALQEAEVYLQDLDDEDHGRILPGMLPDVPLDSIGRLISAVIGNIGPDQLGTQLAIGSHHIVQLMISLIVPYETGRVRPIETIISPPHFRARKQIIRKIRASLRAGCRITLSGAGGIGKTAIVAKVLDEELKGRKPPRRFSDGVVVCDCQNNPYAEDCFLHIIRLFGGQPETALGEQVRHVLANKRVLIVLDGSENLDNLDLVLKTLDTLALCGVILTTEDAAQAPDSQNHFEVDVLPKLSGIALLQRIGGRYADNKAACSRIYELCGGLPLALEIAAGHVRTAKSSVTDFANWLEEQPLQALDRKKRQRQSISTILARSIDIIDDENAISVLKVIGILGQAPLQRPIIEIAIGNPNSIDVQRGLDRLVQLSFLRRTRDGYRALHPLIYHFVRKRLIPERSSIERLVTYYQEQLKATKWRRKDARDRPLHLVALLQNCTRFLLDRECTELALTADPFLSKTYNWYGREKANTYGLECAQRSGDVIAIASLHCNLSDTYLLLGKLEQASEHANEGLLKALEVNDQVLISVAYGRRGKCFASQGSSLKAACEFRSGLNAAKRVGNRQLQGEWLGNVGICFDNSGKYKQSIRIFEKAVNVADEIGDKANQCRWLGSLGLCYSNLGRFQEAIRYHRKAINCSRKLRDKLYEGRWSGHLGETYLNWGDFESAKTYYQKAFHIAQKIGDRLYEGIWLGNIGHCFVQEQEWSRAEGNYIAALAIAHEVGDQQYEALWQGYLGVCFASQGRFYDAVNQYDLALAGLRRSPNALLTGLWWGNLGLVATELRLDKEASYLVTKGIELLEEQGALEIAAEFRLQHAYNLLFMENYRLAEEIRLSVYDLAQMNGWQKLSGKALLFQSAILFELGKIDEGLEASEKAYELLSIAGMPESRIAEKYVDVFKAMQVNKRIEAELAELATIENTQGLFRLALHHLKKSTLNGMVDDLFQTLVYDQKRQTGARRLLRRVFTQLVNEEK